VKGPLSGRLFVETKEIFINSQDRTAARQRFTMAHELGHWELRHSENEEIPPDSQGFAGAFENEGETEGRSPVEVEANCFAAELLMPSAWLKKERKPVPAGRPDALAALYGVSREAMFYQLMRCNLI
jgi:Zn-dependent peptidase ImmA (M78 family)